MKFFWILFLVTSTQVHAEDVGDGTDGACTVTAAGDTQITAARTTYQCTSLTIDAPLIAFNGTNRPIGVTAPLVIKVQNNVVVTSTINLNGADGLAGDTAGPKDGGLAGAGGGNGGNSPALNVDGLNGLGNVAGVGVAGKKILVPAPTSTGGGGGGGSYGTEDFINVPTPGNDTNVPIPASVGANGHVYGSEATFETTFTGGSGGGAGGGGFAGVNYSGSSGAGSGGAVHIIAGGNITINGSIVVNGGDGGGIGGLGGTQFSGGGGGGSGGGIWLQAAGQITVNGSLSAIGGFGGETDIAPEGFGGNGGLGRIRLDDGDGNIAGAGSVTPAAFTSTFTPTPIPGPTPTPGTSPISVRQYSSGVSCARVALDASSENFAINLILGLGLALGFGLLAKRKVRTEF